ncbi:hypothetical protein D3C78_1297180 [compost metagenome]
MEVREPFKGLRELNPAQRTDQIPGFDNQPCQSAVGEIKRTLVVQALHGVRPGIAEFLRSRLQWRETVTRQVFDTNPKCVQDNTLRASFITRLHHRLNGD